MTRLNLHTRFSLEQHDPARRHRRQTLHRVEVRGSRTVACESIRHDVSSTTGSGGFGRRMSLIRAHLQCYGVTGMLQSLVTYRLLKSCSAKPYAPPASAAVSLRRSSPVWPV